MFNGDTLINCLAYIDLNPVRAGICDVPEDHRWCFLGYHVRSGNKEGFLSLNFGLKDRFRYRIRYFTDSGIIGTKEFVFRCYLKFKDYFSSCHEKRPQLVAWLDGTYSLKRFSE